MEKTYIVHKCKVLDSGKTGVSIVFNNERSKSIEKYLVSFDEKNIIERIKKDDISFGEKISKIDFYKRLIRDIQASDEQTREIASEILCYFLEVNIVDLNLDVLKPGIEQIIKQITAESNINSEHKLVEGLFEFIWSKKLSKKEETELLERLTEIDKYYVWSYLGDEIVEDIASYNSKKLTEYYLANLEKWKERDIRMYGREKTEKYYKNKDLF